MAESEYITDLSKHADLPLYPLPKSEKHEKQLRECIVGEFMNVQEPGVSATCRYGNTKKNVHLTFIHGGKYKIPRFLKEHMESLGEAQWKWQPDGSGSMRSTKAGIAPRFQFREVYA